MIGMKRGNRRLALKAARISHQDRILDLGCGDGTLTRQLAQTAREAIGIDDRTFLGRLEARLPEAPNLLFLQATLEGLPFDDESFDLILSANAWHRFRDRESLLYETVRILKPAGRLVFTDACALWGRELSSAARLIGRYYAHVETRRTLSGMLIRAQKLL